MKTILNIFKTWALALIHPLATAMLFAIIVAYFVENCNSLWFLLCFPALLIGYYFNILIRKMIFVWRK